MPKRRRRWLRFAHIWALPAQLYLGDIDHPSSWALRVVRRFPRTLINTPEQVVLNFAFSLMGFAGLFLPEGSLIEQWQPPWIHIAWSLAMIVGGLSILVGLFRGYTTLERLGYLLIGPSCFWFGLSALIYRGFSGITVFGIFTAIGIVKIIRMILTSAARDTVIELGQKMDRDAERGGPDGTP
jgi:hypothetical protein